MKTTRTPLAPRAALYLGAALLSTPALAQEVAPPPVVTTQPAPAPASPPVTFAPSAPVVQTAPAPAEPEAAPARPAARAAPARPAPARQPQRTAPAPAAPVEASGPPPEAAPPEPVAEAPAPIVAPVPEPLPEPAPVAVAPAEPAPAPLWPWLLAGALLIAGAVAALLFRRRRVDAYEPEYEPAAIEPAAVPMPRREAQPAPLAAAPVVAGEPVPAIEEEELSTGPIAADAHASKADREDLAGIADKPAPVSQRPWLELGMRPLRAGTSADEALVEIELIIGNSGDTPAENVRISTFLLPSGVTPSEMETHLIERADDASVPPQTIRPGEGTRVDATLALHKSDLGESFSPVVVADARYRLPDGSEGRTSASFRVGIDEGDHVEPIALDRPEMHDNVAAELYGKPAHA